MEERYFFDKRVMKKILIKYGIIFACLFPVLIVLNYFLNQVLNFWITVVIDCVVVLFVLFIIEAIINKIKEAKQARENDFVVIKAKEIKARRNKPENQETIVVENNEKTEKKEDN